MTEHTTEWLLVGLFAIHLVAFVVLTFLRRSGRFIPAMVTFALLVALNLCKALDVGDAALYETLRSLAYIGLALSITSWVMRRRATRADKLDA